MELAASVGGAAVAGVAGIIGIVIRRSLRHADELQDGKKGRASSSKGLNPAAWPEGNLFDGQLLALFFEERQVHATAGARGAVASLSEVACQGRHGSS